MPLSYALVFISGAVFAYISILLALAIVVSMDRNQSKESK